LPESGRFNWYRVIAAAGVILIPASLGLLRGVNQLSTFLKTYGVLVVVIYIAAKGGTWLKRLRRRDFCGYFKAAEGTENTERNQKSKCKM